MKTPLSKLVMVDREGAIPISIMHHHFEEAMRQTPKFSEQPLERATVNGHDIYKNDETNLVWNGFALGMRCAERIETQIFANESERSSE